MKSDFLVALTQLAAERGLPREIVLTAIEAGLVSAYRKDSITAGQNVTVRLDPGSGDVTVFILKTVVEEVTNDLTEILPKDAKKIKAEAELGDTVITESIPHTPGRIAAQTAKQVVMQRLREAERELVFQEYEGKEGEVFSVTVQRVEPRQVIVDLGRAEAVMPPSEQVISERYRTGTKMKVLLQAVERSGKGPELIVSRADRQLLKRLFEMEVPEIYNGAVEIQAIAREPGSRSKVAVRAIQDGVDPVGSCVGLRGVRIQNIVNELQGEKIDVMEWNRDPAVFITNALSPAQVMKVDLDEDGQYAIAVVPERQLSLAIGKEGQNARLAARLTGWKVDIKSNVEYEAEAPEREERAKVRAAAEKATVVAEAEEVVTEALEAVTEAVESEAETEVAEPVAEPVEAELEVVAPEAETVEEVVEEPAVELEEVTAPEAEVIEAVEEEEEAEEEVAEEEEKVLEPVLEAAPEPAVAVAERSAPLREVSEDVWAVRRARRSTEDSDDPGRIRFAEDIAGLRGGVTAARRGRRGNGAQPAGGARKRKAKGGRRRR